MRPWIFYLIAGLIAYGSLYPFDFAIPVQHDAAWARLFSDWSLLFSRMDALGNVLLFVPFGLVGILGLAAKSNVATRVLLVAVLGFLLALTLQIAQLYVPGRTPTLSDVLWNVVGIGAGIFIALNVHVSMHRIPAHAILPMSVIALWLIAELLPFVPSLDVQSVKTNLKGLLDQTIAGDQLLLHAAGMLMSGHALSAVVGERRALRWLVVLGAIVVAGKTFIVTLTLTISALIGLAVGFAAWALIGAWRTPKRSAFIAMFLIFAYGYGALTPFEFRGDPDAFGLLPFAGLLRGSMLSNLQSLAGNLFLCAGVLYSIAVLGGRLLPCAILLCGLVLMFEVIQMFIVGRNPEITEPLLVLLLGILLQTAYRAHERLGETRTATHAHGSPQPQPPRRPPVAPLPHRPLDRAVNRGVGAEFRAGRWVARVAGVCLVMAIVFHFVLRLPQIPYNVTELFLGGGAFPFLFIFALSLLWIGAGANLVNHYLSASKRPWLGMPLLTFGAAMVSLLLMYASVTDESIGDISGSNNLHWFVINKEIWGEWAKNLFAYLPPELVAFFERPVRYAALYVPLVTTFALTLLFARAIKGNATEVRGMGALLIVVFFWLWLCKLIAFTWSSTDNLNELIARDSFAGWSGGAYLYMLLALICANAAILAQVRFTWGWIVVGLVVTGLAVPVGWWLLNSGLEPYVVKYGQTFSGAQFLLGPDRKHILSENVLFARWAAVQFFGVLVLAAGARLVQPLLDWLSAKRVVSGVKYRADSRGRRIAATR